MFRLRLKSGDCPVFHARTMRSRASGLTVFYDADLAQPFGNSLVRYERKADVRTVRAVLLYLFLRTLIFIWHVI